ncbi:unnamed protein product, partial [Mesorhabditis spiculigera]
MNYAMSTTAHSPVYTNVQQFSTTKTDELSSTPQFEPLTPTMNFSFVSGIPDAKVFVNADEAATYFASEENRSNSALLDRQSSSSPGDYSTDSERAVIDGAMPVRREKKKQQNREAATRYREKKRKERVEAKVAQDELVGKNEILKTKLTELQHEVNYLKRFMQELGIQEDSLTYISPTVPL